MGEFDSAAVNTMTSHEQSYAGLLPLLRRLDRRLAAAVEAAERIFAARAAGDLYRGLAISPADVAAAFGRTPGEPFLPFSLQAHDIAEDPRSLSLRRLLWLQRVHGLTDFDRDVILVGLAPEIDLRYEHLYAYLHDDVTRRRPSVDLALNLLCASASEKLQQRERFAPDAPLLRHRLIELATDPHHPNPPLLGRSSSSGRADRAIAAGRRQPGLTPGRVLRNGCIPCVGQGAPLTEAMQRRLLPWRRAHTQSPLRTLLPRTSALRAVRRCRAAGRSARGPLLNADLRSTGA